MRALIFATDWRLLAEQDAYDSVFRAWRISAQWSSFGDMLSLAAPPPEPPPEMESFALFIPLHRYTPPEPPPLRGFASGFDEGFA